MAAAIQTVPAQIAIGIVQAITGTARAENPLTGEIRDLRVGDAVYADDIIITGPHSAISIELRDGTHFDLGGNSRVALDAEVFNPATLNSALPGQNAEPALIEDLLDESSSSIDAIQQALLAGEDPSQLEATAAGPAAGGGEEEGSSFVVLSRSNQSTTPQSGFNTNPISPEFSAVQPEDPPVSSPTVVPIDLQPVANDDAGEMFEDDAGVRIPNNNDLLGDDPHILEWVGQHEYGTLTYDVTTNEWVFTPSRSFNYLAQGESVQAVFHYTLTDADGDSDPATVTVTIRGTNDAPVFDVQAEGFSDQGSVTEITDGAEGENVSVHLSGGSLVFGDVDLSDRHELTVQAGDDSYLGSFLAEITDVSTGDGAGAVRWQFSVPDAVLDSLAEGQQIVQTYSVTVTDPFGASATHVVTVTITGTNDAPVITAADDSATVTELPDGSENENAFLHERAGTISFADVDLLDTHTIQVTPQGVGYLGDFGARLTDAATGDQSGAIGWTFSLEDAPMDYLAAGETLVQQYLVTVTDNHGASAQQMVTITIVGTNDAPVITGADDGASIAELADGSTNENNFLHERAGTISFGDVDLLDTHTIQVEPQGAGYLGSFGAGLTDAATGDQSGAIGWTFSVQDAALDYLAAGQSLTQQYLVTVTDNNGASAQQLVTITITGTNDAPVFDVEAEGFSDQGAVTEIADRAPGENVDVHQAGGSLVFGDVDLRDTHVVSVENGGESYLGAFVATITDPSTGDGAGAVSWQFSVPDAALDSLAAGQQLVQTYVVTVTDPFGGSASHTVTVTITGTNDAPVITAADDSASVAELADGSTNENNFLHERAGTIAFGDVDLLDTHTIQVEPQGAGYLGSFGAGLTDAATGDQSGAIGWTFSVQDAALDYLAAGQSLTQQYLVTVTDNNGASAQQLVTITITGTNDAPVIVGEGTDATGAVTEILEDAEYEGATLSDAGVIAFSDVDLADNAHSATVTGSSSTHTALLGSLVLGGVDQSGKTVGWTYSVADSAVNFLRVGATIVETFTVQISDGKGGTTTQNVVVTITGSNDRPVISGVATGTVTEDGDSDTDPNTVQTVSGQLAVADDDLGDTHSWSNQGFVGTTHSSGTTVFGTFSVDATGKWTYVLNNALAQQLKAGQTIQETYKVQVQDNSGVTASDKAFQNVVITIVGTNDVPVVAAARAVVSEEGLPGGRPDTVGQADTTNATVFTGSFNITDVDNDVFFVTLVKPADGLFKSGGQNITWTLSEDKQTLTGSAGAGGKTIITVVVTDAGTYTVTLLGGVDHPLKGVEDNLSFDIPVRVSDGVSTVPTTLTVTVEDDSPEVMLIQDGIMANEAGTLSGQLQFSFGGDGAGGIDLSGSKAPAGLVYVVNPGLNGSSVLTAYAGTATAGNEYFKLTVYSNGEYQFNLINPTPVTTTDALLKYVAPGNYPGGITSSAFGVNGTKVTFFSSNGAVNVSQGQNAGIGVGNNLLEAEQLRLTFTNVISGLKVIVNDVHSTDLLKFSLHDASGTKLAEAYAPPPANAPKNGGGLDGVVYDLAKIFGASLPANGFSQVVIHGDEQGDPVRLSNFSVDEPLFPKTQNFLFNVGVADADGDTASGSFNVTVSADLNSAGGYVITGKDGVAETMLGSSKNDTFKLSSVSGDSIDGGDGFDTLLLNGHIDLRGADISRIERISMFDADSNDKVTLAASDVLQMSETNTLQIIGNNGDTVALVASDSWQVGATSGGFTTYTSTLAEGVATLQVQVGLTVTYINES